ncbi:MAG: hypothetical protein U1U88_000184, partial [Lawsonella clevelandensis]
MSRPSRIPSTRSRRQCNTAERATSTSWCLARWAGDRQSRDTVKLARLATQTGLFPAYEAEAGEITSVMKIRRPVPVEEYLRRQRRFAHIFKNKDTETLPVAGYC